MTLLQQLIWRKSFCSLQSTGRVRHALRDIGAVFYCWCVVGLVCCLLLCMLLVSSSIVPGWCVSVRWRCHHVNINTAAWLHAHSTHLDPEDGGRILLRNIGIFLHDYKLSRLRVFHGNMFLYFTLCIRTSSRLTPRSRCRDSSVGIPTGWTAGVQFWPETRDFLYLTASRPALGPTQPLYNWGSHTSTPPYIFMA
jgi:hypothetical protein